MLGLGLFTQEWFEHAGFFKDDREVLIILLDSKGAPTATEEELARRRGKRRRRSAPQSARHRDRRKRNRYGSKPRRKPGDKSKHARMATMVVMYTLTRVGRHLLGPVNRWCYASFAPKKHAVAVALREAAKRCFGPESGKLVQVLTDGDNDLARYVAAAFPKANPHHRRDARGRAPLDGRRGHLLRGLTRAPALGQEDQGRPVRRPGPGRPR